MHECRALGTVDSAVVALHHPLMLLVGARPNSGLVAQHSIPAFAAIPHEFSQEEEYEDG